MYSIILFWHSRVRNCYIDNSSLMYWNRKIFHCPIFSSRKALLINYPLQSTIVIHCCIHNGIWLRPYSWCLSSPNFDRNIPKIIFGHMSCARPISFGRYDPNLLRIGSKWPQLVELQTNRELFLIFFLRKFLYWK